MPLICHQQNTGCNERTTDDARQEIITPNRKGLYTGSCVPSLRKDITVWIYLLSNIQLEKNLCVLNAVPGTLICIALSCSKGKHSTMFHGPSWGGGSWVNFLPSPFALMLWGRGGQREGKQGDKGDRRMRVCVETWK